MRTTHRIYQGLTAGVFALALLVMAARATADQGPVERYAKVLKAKNAQFVTKTGEKGPVAPGMFLRPGTEIRTAADGEVDLRLGEQPVNLPARLGVPNPAAAVIYNPQETGQNLIHIFADTVLGIDKLIEEETGAEKITETKLNLKAGKILGDVKKLSASSKYEVTLPTGVAGIRGSTYAMGSDGSVTMLTGSAVIVVQIPIPGTTQVINTPITVNAGESFNATAFINAVLAAYNDPTLTTPAQKLSAAQNMATQIANSPPTANAGSPLSTASAAQVAAITGATTALITSDASNPGVTVTAKDNTVIYVSPK